MESDTAKAEIGGASPLFIVRNVRTALVRCAVVDAVAARRCLERGLADEAREYNHGDNLVVHYRKTGEILPPAEFTPPKFDVPTIEVSTDGEYIPTIDEIVKQIRSSDAQHAY